MDKWGIIIWLGLCVCFSGGVYLDTLQEETIDTYSTIIINQNEELYDNTQQLNELLFKIELYNKTIDIIFNQNQQLINEIQDYKDIIIEKDLRFERKQGLILKPTYDEVLQFLEDDKTNKNEWTKDYDCTQFAQEVMRNAFKVGIYSCVVRIDFDDGTAHNIIVFKTSDFGIQYFEPQTDENIYMYPNMDYAGYLNYPEEVNWIVKGYDSCFERVI